MKKITAIVLALTLMLTLCMGSVSAEGESLAGTYFLDATQLGMPLTVYLTVDENSNFQWSNKLTDGADKGSGQIGAQDGLYMMVYSDSTPDSMKTATFTVEGNNLVFSTRIPYGSSGFSPNTEDEANVIYPVAKKMLYTEYLGEYVGALEVEAMGSAIVYNADLVLTYGAEYTLTSTFDMGGETYSYEQAGLFTVEDGQLTLICEGKDDQTGAITADGITVGAFLSQMASSPREIELKKATTAEVAGVYTGVKDMTQMMGIFANAALTLDAVGGYSYIASIEGEEDYLEEGTFTVDGSAIVLQPAEGDAIECTLENGVLNAKMRINKDVPMSTAIVFYGDAIQGEFTAEGTDDAGAQYSNVLTLNADGTYTIVVNKDGAKAYEETGTFATEASMMGTSLVLTAADGTVSTGMVDATINITHNIDAAFNTQGFKYTK